MNPYTAERLARERLAAHRDRAALDLRLHAAGCAVLSLPDLRRLAARLLRADRGRSRTSAPSCA